MVVLMTGEELASILNMKDVIEAVEEGFRQFTMGTVKMPLRLTIPIEKNGGKVFYMPAFVGGMDALAMKVASVYPSNPENYNLPTILSTILLNDPETGALLSIMDGAFITAMRTGAAGGIAIKYLARSDSKTVGLFGCGVQARTQLIAASEVRRLEKVKAYARTSDKCKRFCDEMSEKLKIEVIPASDPRDVVKDSDIIITATTSKQPVFNGEWLEKGTHVNGIGSHFGPGIRELDEITVKKSKIVVDSREASLKEAGDLIDAISMGFISQECIHAELGEIILGEKEARTSDDEVTLFKSVGLALQDAVTAKKVYDVARTLNAGKTITV